MKKVFLASLFFSFLSIASPSIALAAITFDASTVGPEPTRGAMSETYSHTVGSGSDRYLVVSIARNDDTTTAPDDVTGVTYDGVAMTRLVALDGNGDGRFLYSYLYGLANPTPGTHNVVISLTGSTGSRAYSITASYAGVRQTGQPDATASITASIGNPVSTTLTTVADNSWIVASAADNNPPYTGSGVLTTRGGGTNASSLLDSNGALTPAGAKTISITATGRNSLVGISLAPADATTTIQITGSGTANKLAKFTATTTIGDSLLSDDGINTTLTSGNFLMQIGAVIDTIMSGVLNIGTTIANAITIGRVGITTTIPGILSIGSFTTTSNCNSTTSPAVCGPAPAGSVALANGGTTLVVNATAVTANSQIFIMEDPSLATRLGITCNTGTGRNYVISARTPGTSFTIKSSNAPILTKACLSYWIVN